MPREYADCELALLRSFGHSASVCQDQCECGRVFFVTADGHGDYSPGELAGLYAKEAENPDKFRSVDYATSIDCVDIAGRLTAWTLQGVDS